MIGEFYGAMRWASEDQARAAWEAAFAYTNHCSVWRIKTPLHPPHRDHIVIVMGEDEDRVLEHLERLTAFGGRDWALDDDLVEALRKRRTLQAIENARTGDSSVRVSRGIPRSLDHTGRMTPLEEEGEG